MTRAERRVLSSAKVAATPRFFSQAVQVGEAIYVSGQVAMDEAGRVVGKGDMRAQTRQVIENLRLVLAEAGATLDDVVKVTMYVTDMKMAGEAREVRLEHFATHPPASTGVEVKGLAHPDLLVEMDAIAVIRKSEGS